MRKKAFTFIELVGVLFIISILSLYAVPKISAVQERVEMKQFIADTKRVIENAQLQSREEKTSYGVLFTSEGYVKVNDSLKFQSSLTPYPNKLKFRTSTFENDVVLFEMDGSPVSAGKVEFLLGKSFKLIELEVQPATGRVKSKWE